jgi:hypothetical protein
MYTMNNVVIDNTMTEVTFSATKVKKNKCRKPMAITIVGYQYKILQS